jgi:transaldolase
MTRVEDLKVKIFADGADLQSMLKFAENPLIKGFTTNPSLMRSSGVTDYVSFAKDVLEKIPDRHISFEVFADDFPGMESQANMIASWGENVYAKIPISNSKSESSCETIGRLSSNSIKVNVTALFTPGQVEQVAAVLSPETPAVISVFAGRIADTGVDPMPIMLECKDILRSLPKAELLWASSREVYNIFQADQTGCEIITLASDVLNKLSGIGKNLEEYSLETVRAFCRDAEAAGFSIATG